jgi:hypothetical protein
MAIFRSFIQLVDLALHAARRIIRAALFAIRHLS